MTKRRNVFIAILIIVGLLAIGKYLFDNLYYYASHNAFKKEIENIPGIKVISITCNADLTCEDSHAKIEVINKGKLFFRGSCVDRIGNYIPSVEGYSCGNNQTCNKDELKFITTLCFNKNQKFTSEDGKIFEIPEAKSMKDLVENYDIYYNFVKNLPDWEKDQAIILKNQNENDRVFISRCNAKSDTQSQCGKE